MARGDGLTCLALHDFASLSPRTLVSWAETTRANTRPMYRIRQVKTPELTSSVPLHVKYAVVLKRDTEWERSSLDSVRSGWHGLLCPPSFGSPHL
ncbi:hypothetical protein BST61_g11372 [Cercospora zeina]